MSEIPAMFPTLRWGFIEASAQWVPWLYREAAIRYRVAGRAFPQNVFEEYNIFVTCQTNDDISYIVSYAGENRLVIGTDYGHTDPSSAVTALNEFQRMEGIDSAVKEKILSHNAKALYEELKRKRPGLAQVEPGSPLVGHLDVRPSVAALGLFR